MSGAYGGFALGGHAHRESATTLEKLADHAKSLVLAPCLPFYAAHEQTKMYADWNWHHTTAWEKFTDVTKAFLGGTLLTTYSIVNEVYEISVDLKDCAVNHWHTLVDDVKSFADSSVDDLHIDYSDSLHAPTSTLDSPAE
jgi:hypothetical protein